MGQGISPAAFTIGLEYNGRSLCVWKEMLLIPIRATQKSRFFCMPKYSKNERIGLVSGTNGKMYKVQGLKTVFWFFLQQYAVDKFMVD